MQLAFVWLKKHRGGAQTHIVFNSLASSAQPCSSSFPFQLGGLILRY